MASPDHLAMAIQPKPKRTRVADPTGEPVSVAKDWPNGGDRERGEEHCGREMLRKHRMEMAGRVWVPETWGQESLLKEWIDSSVFDKSLVPKGLLSARAALVDECRRRNSKPLRIENKC
ncbi:protein BIC1-like [Typha latifolia]|uniref:protein BIC1-like n=1 Tax=Typha latifolia TaxID=4733 RepID=UPI003C2DF3CC